MLRPATASLRPLPDQRRPSLAGYSLADVALDIPDASTAVFRATLNGPTGAKVWARAWLSNEIDGTSAETVSPCLVAGDAVSLTVKLRDGDERIPEIACIRIESAPLATEQIVIIQLPR